MNECDGIQQKTLFWVDWWLNKETKNKRQFSACVHLEDIYSLIRFHFPKLLYLSLKYSVINYTLLYTLCTVYFYSASLH